MHKLTEIKVKDSGTVVIKFRHTAARYAAKELAVPMEEAERLMDTLNEELLPVIKRRRATEEEKRAQRIAELRAELMALEGKPRVRTKADVLRERKHGSGCCDRYNDCKACDCLTNAAGQHPCMVCHDPNCTNPSGQH